MRGEPGRRPIDRLREHLRIDRLAVGIERARADALGGRRAGSARPARGRAPRRKCGRRRAAPRSAPGSLRRRSRAYWRAADALRAHAARPAGRRCCGSATARCSNATGRRQAPVSLRRLAIEAREVAAGGERQCPVETQPIGDVGVGVAGEEGRDVRPRRRIVLAQPWARAASTRRTTPAGARASCGASWASRSRLPRRAASRASRKAWSSAEIAGFGRGGGAPWEASASRRRRPSSRAQREGRIDCKSSRQHRIELDHAISAASREMRLQSRDFSRCFRRGQAGR